MVHPDRASSANPTRAAASTSSTSSRAQTGYSVTNHSNSVQPVARPRVIHWYRWWWVLTSPAVTMSPSTRRTSSLASAGTDPTASIMPSRTATSPG